MPGSDASNPSSIEEFTDADWETLGELLEAYSQAWENAPPIPSIADFVPAVGSRLRKLALVELIKCDLDLRSADPDLWLSLTHYQQDWPELESNGLLPPDLVFEASQIHRRVFDDDHATLMRDADQFPGGMEALTRLVSMGSSSTTALHRSRKAKTFEPGDEIDDFDLLLRLGAGAFATVFLARQNSMQRLVALKISTDQGFEPQTLAQLDHPHIVRVYDHRDVAAEGVRLMYMQYIPGLALSDVQQARIQAGDSLALAGRDLLRIADRFLTDRGEAIPVQSENRRRLETASWSQAISHLGQQIASALDYAHSSNVLHRDLKPANVLLDANCHVKLVDFNVSFCSKLDGVTPASCFGGSMAYMSPEQLQACSPWHDRSPEALTGKSDVFSLGVLLFELLTGNRPFRTSVDQQNLQLVVGEMLDQHRRGLADADCEVLNRYPQLLRETIGRALEFEESRRPTAAAIRRSLAWSGHPQIEEFTGPPGSPWKRIMEGYSLLVVCFLTLVISAIAASFIATYNLMESVPELSQVLFQQIVWVVNAILFSIGGAVVIGLALPLTRALKKVRLRELLSETELLAASRRTWSLGHGVALMCIALWSIAGLLYPTILYAFGAPIASTGWFDFISSHVIAGLIAGSYSFWSISLVALKFWQPTLMLASLEQDRAVSQEEDITRMGRRVAVQQVVAMAMPLLALAWLLWWGRAQNEIAMGVVTMLALAGLAFLVWAVFQVQRQLNLIRSLEACEEAK